jgi:hypothetical protein
MRYLAVTLALMGCTSSHPPDRPVEAPPAGTATEALIGSEGGTIDLGELALAVPVGALDRDTMIKVTVTDNPAPARFGSYSKVYRFEPSGLRFAAPASIEIPFEGSNRLATIFWTNEDGNYAALRTTIDGHVARAEIEHFSMGFVGTACEGESCCRQATGELDVLFNVDSSNSMAEEQASLAAEIPRMAEILATGDIDGDGIQDFPAVTSLHVGTVSTDMGSGGFHVMTCDDEPNFGDDGVLRTAGNPDLTGCAASYPPFQEYMSGMDPTAFAHDVACVATLGIGGCGFEQQLESPLKALTPSTIPMFAMGTGGHGDTVNAGFMREDSVLAVIELTDEQDCSTSDPELFNIESATYTGDLNLRCFLNPTALHPISRFADGLVALRSDPASLVYATISGTPPDLVSSTPDYDAILADPRMAEVIDPSFMTRLTPSCDVVGRGMAFPPRRSVELAKEITARGGAGVVQSICQSDFTPAIAAILEHVSARLSGACGP